MGIEIFVALGALVFSLISFVQSNRMKMAQNKAETIREVWGAFDNLSALRLEYADVSYVIEMPEYYDAALALVKKASSGKTDAELAQLLIKERALARRTYSLYEQMLFEFEHSRRSRSKDQSEFLELALNNLAGRMLLNPRLAFYWQREDGLSVASYFEADTHHHYNKKVRPRATHLDHVGAFAAGLF